MGHLIATLRATDPDQLGTLSFSLIGGGDDGKFLLEAQTGKLRLQEALDRELKDIYKLEVRVSDGVQHTDTFVLIQVRAKINTNSIRFEEFRENKQFRLVFLFPIYKNHIELWFKNILKVSPNVLVLVKLYK